MESSGAGSSLGAALNESIAKLESVKQGEDAKTDDGLSFTMRDVYQELEQLKSQVKPSKRSTLANRHGSRGAKSYDQNKHSKFSGKADDPISRHVSSLNPWSYYNREVGFIIHNRNMKNLSDEEIIALAHEEIGKRIAYHKERCENNEKRMHVHFRHKLQELKSKIDRSRAIVLTFVLQSRKEEEIEILERKLFPFSTRVLLSMD